MDYYWKKQKGEINHKMKKKNAGRCYESSKYTRANRRFQENLNRGRRALIRSIVSNKDISRLGVLDECFPSCKLNRWYGCPGDIQCMKPTFLKFSKGKTKKKQYWGIMTRKCKKTKILRTNEKLYIDSIIYDYYKNPTIMFDVSEIYDYIKRLFEIEDYVLGFQKVINLGTFRDFLTKYMVISRYEDTYFKLYFQREKRRKYDTHNTHGVYLTLSNKGDYENYPMLKLYEIYSFEYLYRDLHYYFVTPTNTVCYMRGYHLAKIKNMKPSMLKNDSNFGKGMQYGNSYSTEKGDVDEDDDTMGYDVAKIVRKHIVSLFE